MRDFPLKKIGIAVGAMVIVTFGLSHYKEQELGKLEEVARELDAEKKKLKVEEDKIAGYELQKKALEADEKMIRDKINTVTELIADRETPPKILAALSESLPGETWIENFLVDGGKVRIQGFAVDYNRITDFMQNFERSAFFEEVQLVNTAQGKDSLGKEVATFQIEAKRRVQIE